MAKHDKKFTNGALFPLVLTLKSGRNTSIT